MDLVQKYLWCYLHITYGLPLRISYASLSEFKPRDDGF